MIAAAVAVSPLRYDALSSVTVTVIAARAGGALTTRRVTSRASTSAQARTLAVLRRPIEVRDIGIPSHCPREGPRGRRLLVSDLLNRFVRRMSAAAPLRDVGLHAFRAGPPSPWRRAKRSLARARHGAASWERPWDSYMRAISS